MEMLGLREWHQREGARLVCLNGIEIVADYGDRLAEHEALRTTAGVMDLSFRGRLCLSGSDRARFLHGQVTNDVKRLRVGEGCYAALITAKGKMQSDLNIYCLRDELLLDFEPGLSERVSQRLEKYIIADDAQVVNVAAEYGLVSVQGPLAERLLGASGLFNEVPSRQFAWTKRDSPEFGEMYLVNQPRFLPSGFDIYIPTQGMAWTAELLARAAKEMGGCLCGWDASEIARVEAGIPRFGADMSEDTIPMEAGLEGRAVSYEKGCYIGQEVLSRIRSHGHVNRHLRGLRLEDGLSALPEVRDKLFDADKEAGCITSAVWSPGLGAGIALGYIRRETDRLGAELTWRGRSGQGAATIVELPFQPRPRD
jgi:folate-binding protein YgfZ